MFEIFGETFRMSLSSDFSHYIMKVSKYKFIVTTKPDANIRSGTVSGQKVPFDYVL